MTFLEFIKTNKIKKDTFIAIHNKADHWVYCSTLNFDDLEDYYKFEILSSVNKAKDLIIVVLDYEPNESISTIKYKEELRAEREANLRLTEKTKTRKKK